MPQTYAQLAPGSLLGQLAPANTTTTAIYTAVLRTEITSILVCNTTTSAAKYRIHHDVGGSTYITANALYFDVTIPGNTTSNLDAEQYAGINLSPTDTLGVRTDTANALTFSVYGVTEIAR